MLLPREDATRRVVVRVDVDIGLSLLPKMVSSLSHAPHISLRGRFRFSVSPVFPALPLLSPTLTVSGADVMHPRWELWMNGPGSLWSRGPDTFETNMLFSILSDIRS